MSSYENFRKQIVKKWMRYEERRCAFIHCQNIPGIEYPIQVDHVLDRNRHPHLVRDPKNVVVSCGMHNYLDRDASGQKLKREARLDIIQRELPHKFAFALNNHV